ncbi:MAG: Gldg family protein [Deltaproteobacteria bacterium]|nr:Gldg family protein [Deltaproteobacteria bacterium]
MNPIKTVIKKELRAYFLSPVALIFLGIFLLANLFIFFTSATFFARNIADVRPMFQWMPLLLIFLVAAISMRSWSDEQAHGTLEILMTLPIKTVSLVLGKLFAGVILISIALALTLPLPIMVSTMGDLDWGPVIGGYAGALFLGAAYLAMGMSISSKTNNQIVSLMVTGIVGSIFYVIGSDTVSGFFGSNIGEILRSLGSGSRFYNIERGVLDFRDIFYYLSIGGFFVILNIYFIDMKRVDTVKSQGKKRATGKKIALLLGAANLLAANIWLSPIVFLRADLTEDGQFSVSDSTKKIIDNLNNPVVIAGYFSENTHPLLAPLVPAIRDYLAEYKNAGGKNITVKFENPNNNEDLAQEIAQSYNIKPLPFRVSGRHEQSVVNAYFHILVKCADEYQVLSIDDLVDVKQNKDDVDVQLKNLEYDVTKAIKKVSSGFQSIESVFATMKDSSKLTLFATPDSLPDDMKEVPARVQKIADELAQKSSGKFSFELVNLDGNKAKQQEVMEKYDFQPMATDIFGEHTFFLHMLLQTGDKAEQIVLQGTPTEAAIKTTIEGTFKRSTTGFIKTIGLFTEQPEQEQPNPQLPPQMQPPQKQPDYRMLEQQLNEEFKVNRVDLADGVVPGDIDILIVAKPGTMTDKQKFAIDQYLMGGGAMIVLAGDKKITVDRTGITAVDGSRDLIDMLSTYGVKIESGFVMDSQNANFPVPIEEKHGMFVMKKIKMMNYPFFPDIRPESFKKGNIATSGLQNLIFNWGSAISAKSTDKVKAETILNTSDEAWIRTSTEILPESFENAAVDFAAPDKLSRYALAATLQGSFKSYFADKPSPLFTDDNNKDENAKDENRKKDLTGRTLKESSPLARLAVIGSSELLSDITASIGNQIQGNMYSSNFQFARNLIDWALADTDLLEIRTGGTFARTLKPIEDKTANMWEIFNYLFVLASLGIIVFVFAGKRRKTKSLLEMEGK